MPDVSSEVHDNNQEILAMNLPASRDNQFNKLQQCHSFSTYECLSDRDVSMDATWKIANDVTNQFKPNYTSHLANILEGQSQEDVGLSAAIKSEVHSWVRPSTYSDTKRYAKSLNLKTNQLSIFIQESYNCGTCDHPLLSRTGATYNHTEN